MEKNGNVPDLLQNAQNEIATLRLRTTSLEQRVANIEGANLDLREKVARLERLQVQRQTIELAEPGEPINRSKRSKR